jgi:hypothetical protein
VKKRTRNRASEACPDYVISTRMAFDNRIKLLYTGTPT